jgi:hypothetical membrane protein
MTTPNAPVRRSPYSSIRTVNSIVGLVLIGIYLFTEKTDTYHITMTIAIFSLFIVNAVLSVAEETWKLRHSIYND